MMGFQHVPDAAIKALDHSVGLGRAGFGQAAFNAKPRTQPVKLMLATGLALV